MGKLLGITGAGYGKKENADRKFSYLELAKVCKKLDIKPEDLIYDSLKE